MTDETREQIKRDAAKYASRIYMPGTLRSICESSFIGGSRNQHPIAHAEGVKEGRRQAIEEAIIEVEQVAREVVDTQRDYSIIRSVKQKLEKLKL